MSTGTETTVDVRITPRAELALRGVASDAPVRRPDAPVRRPDGAGPSDDGHVLVDGAGAALPRNPLPRTRRQSVARRRGHRSHPDRRTPSPSSTT
ncbi:hypothetical protein [Streptomyces sp. NPDC051677]|uniref:hypothetical protein n=1 Tax=Streptomyces sp. NPDC051677 TaxID=3365669 RepID=UPI0037D87246